MHIHMTVHGRVQGVSFRYTIQRHAEKLNLYGWVQNEQNGTVTLAAQGNEADVHTFHEWLKNSPGFSTVKQVNMQELPEEKYERFTIRRTPFLQDQLGAIKNFGRNF